MIKKLAFLLSLIAVFTISFGQSTKNKRTVKKIIKLSTQTEFSKIAKLFDTANGRKPINPFILDYLWRDFEEKFGKFKGSITKKEYKKNESEYFIEELQFDSAYVQLKIGFNTKNGMVSSYLLTKTQTKEDRALERKYKIPSYAKKKNIEIREAKFGEAPFVMDGELTLPQGLKKNEKVPAVILVHGSGPGDRNEQAGPLQCFKDIAYGLSTNGIAILRYDKRTLIYSDECSKDKKFDVNKETVDDALAGAVYLRTQKNIDPTKIYILGHSLGGMMLPRMGERDKELAGLIFMAAPAKSLADKIIEQMDYLSKLQPESKKDYDRTKEDFMRLKTKWYDSTTSAQYLPFKSPPSYWMDLDTYNQTQVVQKVKHPMLFLQGARDYQVTVEDYELWKEALKNNKNVTFKLFPQLNHQMTAGEGSELSTPDEYKIPANVDVEVINTIVNWLDKK